ncbi:hypothetical protein AB0469_23130 [Streptomyces sp. NPDC093801]|uniref:P-loop NTPase n=1 Tax=Streptomyces sp. NPDC093801 TaxID=3155203 RepID=UPI00344F54FB
MTHPPEPAGTNSPETEQARNRHERVLRILRGELGEEVVLSRIKELGGGYTGAEVVLADVMRANRPEPEGHVILKVSPDSGERQHEAHQRFTTDLGTYGGRHLPQLHLSAADDRLRVDVYGIAGESLVHVKAADQSGSLVLVDACGEVSGGLLTAQLGQKTGGGMKTVREVLEAWLGVGFPQGRRGRALQETRRMAGISGTTFVLGTRVLPDPWSLLGETELMDGEIFVLEGASHGDLHLRNILIDMARKDEVHYWLIDVNWGTAKPLFYDQAYLETAALLAMEDRLKRPGPAQALITVDTGGIFEIGGQDFGHVVERIRGRALRTVAEREPSRGDSLERLFRLARLGASLNFAAKNMPESLRTEAYRMAGWNALQYLDHYHHELLGRMLAESVDPHPAQNSFDGSAMPTPASDAVAKMKERLAPLVAAVHSGTDGFLIVEDGVLDENMVHLLAHRWSVIIDLNPQSEASGPAALFNEDTAAYATAFRGVHPSPPAARNAVPWVMAGGWGSHGEQAPEGFREWRHVYKQVMEDVLSQHRASSANRSAIVVCVTADSEEDSRTRWIREEIEDLYHESFDALQVAGSSPAFRALLDEFALGQPTRPVGASTTLPGVEGPVPVPQKLLVQLEADLVVLHSQTIEAELRDEPSDEFWRGRPASWLDLDNRLDIPRDLGTELKSTILDVLERQSTKSLELFHTPGAGGSTLARRVAWDLHRDHPVVLVDTYSPGTIERVDQIYRLTGRTVLVVAESADVSQSEREELYRKLKQLNAPAVLLWVTRTSPRTGPRNSVDRPLLKDADDRKFFLGDFMSQREVAQFRKEYAQRARTPRAAAAVQALGPVGLPQQLSPFLFGLIAFEDDFQGTGKYVKAHLSEFSAEERRVAGYLALITAHAQRGVPNSLVRRWLKGVWRGHTAAANDSRDGLEDVLGRALRRLVVAYGDGVRIMHPTIARVLLEAVIDAARGQHGWASRLADLAVEFIDQVAGRMGDDGVGRDLLEHLLINRGNTGGRQKPFSDLILTLGGNDYREDAYRVLLQLTRRYHAEPHFWMHLGRYYQRYKGLQDGQAQKYIEKAIEIAPRPDSTLHHALGLLHRDAVQDALKFYQGSAHDALEFVLGRYESGLRSFEEGRGINPEGEHNYVTAVEMIAAVLEQLPRLAGCRRLQDLVDSGSDVGRWADTQLRLALSLLEACESVDPENGGSGYFVKARDRIDGVTGTPTELILAWRDVSLKSRAHEGFVVALARELLKDEAVAEQHESEDVFRMAVGFFDSAFEQRDGDLADHDLELWFRAFRKLPEYTDGAALARFKEVSENRNSPVASYYLYVIHFMRWLDGEEYDQQVAARYLAEAKRFTTRRDSRWSYEWAAKRTGRDEEFSGSLLAYHRDLGERRHKTSDWERSAEICRRIRGVVRKIDGRDAQVAVEGGEMRAYFPPGSKFHASTHVNKIVEFDLGFAQDGLRAWRVELAQEQRLHRNLREVAPLSAHKGPPSYRSDAVLVAEVPAPRPPIQVSAQMRQQAVQRAKEDARAACQLVIDELLSIAVEDGDVTSYLIGAQLQRTFGDTRYKEMRGRQKLRVFVESLGYSTVLTKDGQFAVPPIGKKQRDSRQDD